MEALLLKVASRPPACLFNIKAYKAVVTRVVPDFPSQMWRRGSRYQIASTLRENVPFWNLPRAGAKKRLVPTELGAGAGEEGDVRGRRNVPPHPYKWPLPEKTPSCRRPVASLRTARRHGADVPLCERLSNQTVNTSSPRRRRI